MNIALISTAPPYRGGISAHTSVLFQHLSINHCVQIFNYTRQYPEFLFPGKSQFIDSLGKNEIPSKRIIDSIGPSSWRQTAKAISETDPDLVIFRFWNPFFGFCLGGISKYVKKLSPQCKQIGLCDNIISHEPNFIDRYLTNRLFSRMDGFLVQSTTVEEELLSLRSNAIYEKRFHPIYNQYGKKVDKEIAKEKIGVDSQNIILYFGLVRHYKGFDTLIHATKLLKDELDDFHIIAAGESYEKNKDYQGLIDQLGLSDVFTWKNEYISDVDVKYYFSASDVVALPYRSASQSGIVQIAYHFDKPVVVSNVGGLPEIVENEVSGFKIDSDNPEQLANTLSKNLKSGRFNELTELIPNYKKQFSWENFTEGIETLFKKL